MCVLGNFVYFYGFIHTHTHTPRSTILGRSRSLCNTVDSRIGRTTFPSSLFFTFKWLAAKIQPPHSTRTVFYLQASILVPDFTVSVYGSSSNYLFLSSLLLLCFFFLFTGTPDCLELRTLISRRIKKRSENEAEKEIIA